MIGQRPPADIVQAADRNPFLKVLLPGADRHMVQDRPVLPRHAGLDDEDRPAALHIERFDPAPDRIRPEKLPRSEHRLALERQFPPVRGNRRKNVRIQPDRVQPLRRDRSRRHEFLEIPEILRLRRRQRQRRKQRLKQRRRERRRPNATLHDRRLPSPAPRRAAGTTVPRAYRRKRR